MLESVHLMCLSVFCVLLLAAAVVDILIRQVPNHLVAGSIVVWLVDAMLQVYLVSAQFAVDGLVGGVVLAAVALVCALLLDRVTGGQSLGGGDVKLLLPIGLFAGLYGGIVALGIACVLALAYCGVRALAKHPTSTFPFAPFLAAGFYAVAVYVQFFV